MYIVSASNYGVEFFLRAEQRPFSIGVSLFTEVCVFLSFVSLSVQLQVQAGVEPPTILACLGGMCV